MARAVPRHARLDSARSATARVDQGGEPDHSEGEAVIAQAIKDVYLKKDRRRVVKVVQQVRSMCRKRGMTAPSEPTIRARVAKISEEEKMRKRGMAEEANRRFTQVRGSFPGADYPLAVVQIDHTMVDLVVVDDIYRLPIGRPWITVGIDVYSRMLPGVHLSFDSPCTASVARCVAQAVLPKEELLLRLGIDAEWPVWGWPTTVHMDNAGEFRGNTLREACAKHGVRVAYRPVKRPHYGAHIERLLGTLMTEIHDLPGTTFSSVEEKGEHDPDKHAALTLSEFEHWLMTLVCKVYHRREHRTLEMSPLKAWELGVFGTGTTPGACRHGRKTARTSCATSSRNSSAPCSAPAQASRAGPTRRRCSSAGSGPKTRTTPGNRATSRSGEIPTDVSRVWFFDPEAEEYFEVPTADQTIPPMSEWEQREVRKHMRAQGTDEDAPGAVAKAYEELREQTEAAQTRTRKARRKMQRQRTDDAQRQAGKANSEAAGETNAQGAPAMTYEPVTPYGAVE